MGRPKKDGTPAVSSGPRGPRAKLGPKEAALKLSGLLSSFDFETQDRIWETAKALRALSSQVQVDPPSEASETPF